MRARIVVVAVVAIAGLLLGMVSRMRYRPAVGEPKTERLPPPTKRRPPPAGLPTRRFRPKSHGWEDRSQTGNWWSGGA